MLTRPNAPRIRELLRSRRIRRLLADREAVTLAAAVAGLRGDREAFRAFKADRKAISHSLWLAGWRPAQSNT